MKKYIVYPPSQKTSGVSPWMNVKNSLLRRDSAPDEAAGRRYPDRKIGELHLILGFIVILALFLRVYRLDKIPPSLSWDETAVGYNAYTIAHWAKDEWGRTLPLVFKSFEDFKHPVHIYTTAFSVRLFGLSDFSIRFPSALFGVFNVVLIFFLGRILFKSDLVGLLAALILAVSPYNLQFSRFNHELNFAVFWFMLGLILFYKGLEKKNYLLPISFVSFGISLLTYHSAKIVIPPLIILLIVLYFRKLIAVKKIFFISLGILAVFILLIFTNPQLLGLARLKQTSISAVNNQSKLGIFIKQYASHFMPQYLFVSGDKNARHSIQTVGEFYRSDAPFLLFGTLFLLWQIVKKRSKAAVLLLSWALLAPLPSAAASEAPHAARAMFMTGSWHLIIAFGIGSLVLATKSKYIKIVTLLIFLGATGYLTRNYLLDYYFSYVSKYAIEWQYGMKQAIQFLVGEKNVQAVYMTNVRQQPYIFVLNYSKYPLPKYLEKVNYNTTLSRSFSLVESFGKYHFLNDLDFAYMPAAYGVYYVLTGPEYTGLFFKHKMEVSKLIKYPNGSDAFYIVTAKDE